MKETTKKIMNDLSKIVDQNVDLFDKMDEIEFAKMLRITYNTIEQSYLNGVIG